jgi:hypothetical protein
MKIRFLALSAVLVFALACNEAPSGGQQGASPEGAATATAATGSTGSGAAAAGGSGTAAASKAASRAAEAATKAPSMMEMEVPSGTPLQITVETAVASNTSKAEDTVRGKVAKAVEVAGMTVIPAGAPVSGTVVEAEESGRVSGRASIAIRFNRVVVANTPYNIRTARIAREAEATKGEDAKKIGIGAGAGALVGAIAGGKKGAAIGTAVGGGAGTGVVLATKGKEVSIPAGTTVRTTIDEPVKINAPM